MGLRDRLRKLERQAEGDTVALRCRACAEEMRVAEDTDLELIAWEWAQQSGGDSHQPTPPDVLVIAGHPCGWRALEVKATGDPWPLMDVGGGLRGLTR